MKACYLFDPIKPIYIDLGVFCATIPAEKSAKHNIRQKFVPAWVSTGLLFRRQADMFKYFVCNCNCKHKRKPNLSFDVCLKAICNQI